MNNRSLFLFNHDLRLNDHALFKQACERSRELMCLYCLEPGQFDSRWLEQSAMGSARFGFLIESLLDLDRQLQKHRQSLYVQTGDARQIVHDMIQRHGITDLYLSQNAGYDEQQLLKHIHNDNPTVHILSEHSQTLFGCDDLPFELNDLPKHFTPFRKQVETIDITRPVSPPEHWPKTINDNSNRLNDLASGFLKTIQVRCDNPYHFAGGSKAGTRHLNQYMNSSAPSDYKKVRNRLDGWRHSTKFSPWLALGCVSPAQIMQRLRSYESQHGANESTYWIYFELLWREFFYWNALKQGKNLFLSNQKHSDNLNANQQDFKNWCRGQTGEPLIDACMNQLNLTGYMSNRGRQIVASYLIHELDLPWQKGAAYFERMLIDYDVASNWGNWQYIAGVGADPRGGRHFNLAKQQKSHDPDGEFRHDWAQIESVPDDILWQQIAG